MNIGAVFGPLIGIFVGAMCIGLFWVDVNNADMIELEPTDENWIGAWWIPFFFNGIIGIILAIPTFGFPNQLPGKVRLGQPVGHPIQVFTR